jgi:hypothetical protein
VRGALLCALAAGACQLGGAPAPTPLRGDTPRTIAVWPVVAASHQAHRELLLDGLDEALRARGHRAIPWAVVREMVDDATGEAPADVVLAATDRVTADAALQLVVRDFDALGTRPLQDARWDLEWRLVSLTRQGVLWSWSNRGSWQPTLRDRGDPHRALDADPEIVPIGGEPRVTYRDAAELVQSLHRLALSHLPEGGR